MKTVQKALIKQDIWATKVKDGALCPCVMYLKMFALKGEMK